MNAIAPPFPTNPSVGEWFGNWTWNGARWVCNPVGSPRTVVTVFTASGPYMPQPGLVSVQVECVGGGGNGGEAAGGGPVTGGGGGGGSGGYSRITLPASLVAGGVNITIGLGGSVPVTPPNNYDYGLGGGPTSFGALCVANGGLGGGGNGSTGSLWGFAGLGASAGVGDLALPGVPGTPGTSQAAGDTQPMNVWAGGGGSIMGGGGASGLEGPGGSAPGYPGTGPGAGGGGATVNNPSTSVDQPGGQGANGICVVTEYCLGTGEDDCLNPPVNVNARVAVTHVPWPGPGPCPPGWGGGPYGEVGYDGDG